MAAHAGGAGRDRSARFRIAGPRAVCGAAIPAEKPGVCESDSLDRKSWVTRGQPRAPRAPAPSPRQERSALSARTRNALLALLALLFVVAFGLHGCSSGGGGGGPATGGAPTLLWDGGNWDQDVWG